MADKQFLEALTRQLADDGKLIETGWMALRKLAIPPGAGPDQVNAMRIAYMAGAQHLFTSIMISLDPDKEPTPKDLNRLTLIAKELEAFATEMKSHKKSAE